MTVSHIERDFAGMPEPLNLEDAEALYRAITLDVQDIQLQLGDNHKTDSNGRRLTAHEFWQWRSKAKAALRLKLRQKTILRDWIKEHKKTNPETPAKPQKRSSVYQAQICITKWIGTLDTEPPEEVKGALTTVRKHLADCPLVIERMADA